MLFRPLPRFSSVRTLRSSALFRSLEPRPDLRRGELVVAGDRWPGRDPAAAPQLVGLGEWAVGGIAGGATDAPGGPAGLLAGRPVPRDSIPLRAFEVRSRASLRACSSSFSRSRIRSSVALRLSLTSLETSSLASPRVIRPRFTASSTTSWIRSREIVTFSSRALRLRSSASRKACTLLSERPAEARLAAPARRLDAPGAARASRHRASARFGFAVLAAPRFAVLAGLLARSAAGLRASGPGRHLFLLELGLRVDWLLGTISSPRPARSGSHRIADHVEDRRDGRVIGEPDREPVVGDLAPAGGHGVGGSIERRPATSRWSSEPGAVGGAARSRRAAGRRLGLARAQVEVAAEDQRRVAGPPQAYSAARRTSRSASARRAAAGARVQVRDPDLGPGGGGQRAGQRHHPPLGAGTRAELELAGARGSRRGRASGSSRPRWRRSGPG